MKHDILKIPTGLNEPVVAAEFLDTDFADEILLVTRDGKLYRKHLHKPEADFVINVAELLEMDKPISIHAYRHYAAVVNTRSTKGLVIDLEKNSIALKLQRGDYHVEHCTFPITFYSREDQVFLIHGTDWNRLDITCLNDGALLTDRMVKYDRDNPVNHLDYFHSTLLISPDEKSFISSGWVWHPWANMIMWRIGDFLTDYELKHQSQTVLDTGESWDRPLCWIDHETIAYAFNEAEGSHEDDPVVPCSELVIQKVANAEVVRRIPFNMFEGARARYVSGTLHFDASMRAFVGFNDEKGTLVTCMEGRVLWMGELKPDSYSTQRHAFLRIAGPQEVEIIQLFADLAA